MKIECLTAFLDGVTRFENGDICTVSDEDGARFCAAGWAKDTSGQTPTAEPQGGKKTLDIQNVASGHASKTL